MGIGVAATLGASHISRGWLLACSLSQSFPALLSSLGNYISQAPLPSGFLVGLANGKHWQAGGGENPRYFSLSPLQAASLPGAGLLCGSSSHRTAPSSRPQVLLDFWLKSHFCPVAAGTGHYEHRLFSMSLQPKDWSVFLLLHSGAHVRSSFTCVTSFLY